MPPYHLHSGLRLELCELLEVIVIVMGVAMQSQVAVFKTLPRSAHISLPSWLREVTR